MWQRQKKPIVGVFGFSGCAGDQLAIIHMEDELIDFFEAKGVISYYIHTHCLCNIRNFGPDSAQTDKTKGFSI